MRKRTNPGAVLAFLAALLFAALLGYAFGCEGGFRGMFVG